VALSSFETGRLGARADGKLEGLRRFADGEGVEKGVSRWGEAECAASRSYDSTARRAGRAATAWRREGDVLGASGSAAQQSVAKTHTLTGVVGGIVTGQRALVSSARSTLGS
jgi:hypothetical protein